ncbi:haloacid dehalogenase [Candidatus Magnetobacterium bavaricum]|uniref:Haloacid dehalogenase n=1 Tax=Candidatus Magnetobacterium bavaricum TaxID=29290 RepID=A0A0F3GS48_9BACT|nr:haloacid dehalogenase [Candidatus Magnetobacterium bavaricum]
MKDIRAVLFDLDDTLYPEPDFVRGGFRAAASYLGRRFGVDPGTTFEAMMAVLGRDGRGMVFDAVLRELGLYTHELTKTLLYLYRSHRPEISLYDDVLPFIDSLKAADITTGLITDGMASVQRSKIGALGLEDLLDVIICTDELGRECWKPSPIPFKVALGLLPGSIAPQEAVYIGDNAVKDFIAPNELGMRSIQIARSDALPHGSDARARAHYRYGGLQGCLQQKKT